MGAAVALVRDGRRTENLGVRVSNVAYGVPWRIDGPLPVEQEFGLLQAAMSSSEPGVTLIGPDVDQDGVERWGNGVSLYPYPPDQADVYDACAPGSFGTTKGFGDVLTNPWFGAMTVWLAETCSSPRISWAGDGGQQLFKARAQVALGAVEGAGVAYEFMTGKRMPSNPHLCDGLGTVYSTPTSVVNGIAILENYIAATSGKLGVIHCTPGAATTMGTFRIDNRAGYIRTINGNIVIPDFGYAKALADGDAYPASYEPPTGTQEWMFATGPINIRRSELITYPDNVIEALDRGIPGTATNNNPNSITYRAERFYAVTCDFVVQAAVLVDRCYTIGCSS